MQLAQPCLPPSTRGHILRSADGGQTWGDLWRTTSPAPPRGVAFATGSIGCVVGGGGQLNDVSLMSPSRAWTAGLSISYANRP